MSPNNDSGFAWSIGFPFDLKQTSHVQQVGSIRCDLGHLQCSVSPVCFIWRMRNKLSCQLVSVRVTAARSRGVKSNVVCVPREVESARRED
jgi:hypothetical protein